MVAVRFDWTGARTFFKHKRASSQRLIIYARVECRAARSLMGFTLKDYTAGPAPVRYGSKTKFSSNTLRILTFHPQLLCALLLGVHQILVLLGPTETPMHFDWDSMPIASECVGNFA